MKRHAILCTRILLIALALVTCRPISSLGPTTWIDRPLDGDQVALEPLTIQAHASDADGVTRFEFLVDSTLLAAVPASGIRPAEADAGWVPPAPGTYALRVRAVSSKGAVGADAISQVIVDESAAATLTPSRVPASPSVPSELQITFTTDRHNLKQGECADLQWDVQGLVEVVQLNSQPVNRAGQDQVCPPQTMTYSLSAGVGGPVNFKHVDIEIGVEGLVQPPACPGPPAIAYFVANPIAISAGQSTTQSWGELTNATSAAIDRGIGIIAMTGGAFGPLSPTTTTTFTLTATGCGGKATRQVIVVVNPAQPPPPQPPVCPGPPAIAFFSANPSTINAGQSATLSWGAVTNATSAAVDPDVGEVPTPGSATVNPGTTRTYTLTATGCGGTVRKQVTIVVDPAPPPPARDTTPPVVSNARANPTSLVKESAGCAQSSRTTTVNATATDVGGVSRVVARVLGKGIEVTMTSSSGNTYQAVLGPFNVTGSLSIVVSAFDNAGNSGQGGPVSIQVSPCIQ